MGCVPCGARKAKADTMEALVTYRDGTTERVPTMAEGRRKLITENKGGGSVRPVRKLAK